MSTNISYKYKNTSAVSSRAKALAIQRDKEMSVLSNSSTFSARSSGLPPKPKVFNYNAQSSMQEIRGNLGKSNKVISFTPAAN